MGIESLELEKCENLDRKAQNQGCQKSSWGGLEKSKMSPKTSRRLPGPKRGDIWSPSAMLVAVKSRQSATFGLKSEESREIMKNEFEKPKIKVARNRPGEVWKSKKCP